LIRWLKSQRTGLVKIGRDKISWAKKIKVLPKNGADLNRY
jgi:hypothetical protein